MFYRIDWGTNVCSRALSAAGFCALLAAAPVAWAETLVFKDVLRPHGIVRGQAEKQIAFKACQDAGASSEKVPAFEACMKRQGWALASIRPDASDNPGATWDDMWQKPNGPRRSDGELQADARACDPTGRNVASPAAKRCMSARGWRLAFVLPERSAANRALTSRPLGNSDVWTDTRAAKRSDAQLMADTSACATESGGNPPGAPTSMAMKRCMRSRGWRYDRTEISNDASSAQYFDPDTGLLCQPTGIAAICSPPEGHVDYYDPKHHLNCHRDGLVKVCTNF
jgi:hypothetical protein